MDAPKRLDRPFEDFEAAARAYCKLNGIDPDERTQYPDPNGYAVLRYRPAWHSVAILMRQQWQMSVLLSIYA